MCEVVLVPLDCYKQVSYKPLFTGPDQGVDKFGVWWKACFLAHRWHLVESLRKGSVNSHEEHHS